jgi:WD40 repeat protein
MAQFAPNGKLLAVNASDHPKVLRLLDPVNGNEIRTIELGERLVRLAFSPDSRHVAITERDNAVRVYETATGRKLHSWTVDLNNPYENYTAAVAISPDGTIVAAGATDNRVHLWEMATGRELTALENRTWYIWALVFSPDGRWLYAAGWDGAIRRWETSNWKEKPVVPDAATGLVAHAPVGSLVAWTADGGAIHFGDPATGKKHRTVPGKPRSFSCLAFNPDGTMLAAANDELSVQLWEVPTGKLLRQWAWPKGKDPHAQVDDMAFTPDGKVLATTCFRMDEVVLWDIATGNRLGQASHEMAQGVVFVPDGRTMVTAGWDRAVRWWSVPDLRQLDSVVLPHLGLFRDNPIADPRFHKIASTSEGHLLATINIGGGITIWDGRNRKVLRSFRAIVGQCQIAFSPNGQWLTTGGHDGSLALWEVRTGQQALKLEGHPTRIFNVAFSPDGRRLVTGSADSTALVWNLQGSTEKHQQPDVATLFSTLASADAAAAYKAIWALVAAPKESVPFLAEKLKPAAAVDEKRIADFIAALDSDKFAEREKATSELEKLGQIAGPALDKLLKGKPSQEAKRRAEAIVAKLGGPVTSAETLRTLRAIEALEHIGTPEAVQVIEKLAKGAAGARETEDARRTLERLKKRGK